MQHPPRSTAPATVKNSNGDTWIGEVTGDLRVSAANGDIAVDRAHAGVDAKTANGNIRIGEVARGTVRWRPRPATSRSASAAGTAAWLDLNTGFGRVRNVLDAAAGPDDTDETVEVRARTSYGDIIIRRS